MAILTTTQKNRLIALQNEVNAGRPLCENEFNEMKNLMGMDISQLHVVETRRGTAGSYLWG